MNETAQENQESEKKKPEKTIRENASSDWSKHIASISLSIIAAGIGLIIGFFVLMTIFEKPFEEPFIVTTLSTDEEHSLKRFFELDSKFKNLAFTSPDSESLLLSGMKFFADKVLKQEEDINNINNRLDELVKLDTTTDVGAQIALTRSDVAAINSRIQILEDGLLENPEKALSIPLIRKDIQKIEDSYEQNFAVMAKSIDRVYDQNKWFIGLMFTMAIGLIALAVSNFIQVQKKT